MAILARLFGLAFPGVALLAACGPPPQDCVAPAVAIAPGGAAAPGSTSTPALAPISKSAPLTSDEGMWTFDNFPSDRVAQRHGFGPSKPWLDQVRLATLRMAQGCSASIVSPNGLVMTNHHCAHTCVAQLSTKTKDFVKDGFYAKAEKDEVKCPEIELNQLVEITDVTARVNEATKGRSGSEYSAAQKSELSKIEKACATKDDLRCDVVSLYNGGLYHLYQYKRFQDVRLVFAPELAAAFFGGDPDNFNFPRYDLDVSFVRIYEGDKPAKLPYLKWSKAGVKEGDLTFVAGNPGGTSRLLTLAELAYQRDVALPSILMRQSERRGVLTEFQNRGAEQKRVATESLFEIENQLKAIKGMHGALLQHEVFDAKVRAEQTLRARVDADPAMKARYGGAWDAIAGAMKDVRTIAKPLAMIEQGKGFWSPRFQLALMLVRAAEELPKPNEQRMREFADSGLPALKQELFSAAPMSDELEIRTLSLSLTQLRESLGPDDPFVKKVLGKDSPEELATALIKGTKLGDVKLRKKLFDGGKAEIAASKDPLIDLARRIDPDARALRKHFEDRIESVLEKNSELIAKARFEIFGTSIYPDATFTPRLSFGVVRGWDESGKKVSPLTTIGGAFDRHTGKDPFALPKSWLDTKTKLNLSTPLNFCSSNDIIGGNSGSPVINKDGEIVGLVFDGNIHSLGGEYVFDDALNRTVSVHSAALLEVLDKTYGAARVLADIKAGDSGAQPGKPPAQAGQASPK